MVKSYTKPRGGSLTASECQRKKKKEKRREEEKGTLKQLLKSVIVNDLSLFCVHIAQHEYGSAAPRLPEDVHPTSPSPQNERHTHLLLFPHFPPTGCKLTGCSFIRIKRKNDITLLSLSKKTNASCFSPKRHSFKCCLYIMT